MRSPNTNVELRQLAGSASQIWNRGDEWVELGGQMSETARELTAIGDSSVHKSKGTDKLAEMASETAVDLSAAAVRYTDTGKALRIYADALEKAQNWIRANEDAVRDAETGFQTAQTAQEDAVGRQRSIERVMPWEDEPEQGDLDAAASDVSAAAAALGTARQHRDEMWTAFDDTFETWSDAYDEAVDSIEKAYETAGNNDGFWEFVDAALDVLAVVLLVLSVIALIIGAPLTGLLAGIILALSVVVLALNALKFAFGRATLGDVALAALGLVPFGIGKVLSRGVPTLSAAMSSGRGAVVGAIRGGLPSAVSRFSIPFTPFRVPVFNPLRAVGNAWTWLRAPATARAALPAPSMFVNPIRSIPLGGTEAVQVQTFLQTMRNSQWATNPGVQQVISSTSRAMPGLPTQILNTGLWAGFTANDIAQLAGWSPHIPVLSDVKVG
ncbi:hypothetical protein [Microbacterium sp. YJN-G]|uniref:hypothetical protein n=1 Tax=Microbacterium sp. YJN-G TaxID=2763257 RepID=UPI0018789596|nr:hypothetical protein [Microbacterium sp. YJN-G]